MSKLQELLDARYPMPDTLNADGLFMTQQEIKRRIFTEGYNAAKEEDAKPAANQNVNMEVLLGNCAAMIKAGHKADAIMTYKRATGASISEAANVLGITTKY
jgi:hypothetical protein